MALLWLDWFNKHQSIRQKWHWSLLLVSIIYDCWCHKSASCTENAYSVVINFEMDFQSNHLLNVRHLSSVNLLNHCTIYSRLSETKSEVYYRYWFRGLKVFGSLIDLESWSKLISKLKLEINYYLVRHEFNSSFGLISFCMDNVFWMFQKTL